MSKADDLFVSMCTDILENGTTTEGQRVRPHWEDGTPAYTIKQFGVVNRYDLRDEFPALTLRRTALKSCMDEVLWIYQKKSTTSTTSRATSGTSGPTRRDRSARPTATRLPRRATTPRETSTRWTECSSTWSTRRTRAAS